MLLAIHKISLLICLVFGVMHLFNKNIRIKSVHKWSGFITLISILIYLFQMNSGKFGYIIYMLIIALTAMIPFVWKHKKHTVFHIGAALSSIVWLVLIHIK